MVYYFYFNLALFIGSTLAILYGFYYLFFKKNEDITEGEFVINLILIIFCVFFTSRLFYKKELPYQKIYNLSQ